MTTDRVLLIINVVETIILILQFVLLNKQMQISRKEINQGYEKERREKTVEYLFQWNEAVHNHTYNLAITISFLPFKCLWWESYFGIIYAKILE